MNVAEFIVNIKAKGDVEVLKKALEYQKELSKGAVTAKQQMALKIAEIRKETEAIKLQTASEKKKTKLVDYAKKELQLMLKKNAGLNKFIGGQSILNKLLNSGTGSALKFAGSFGTIATAIVGATIAVDAMILKLGQANQLYTNFQRQTGLPMQSAINISGAMAGLDVTMTPEDIIQNMQKLQTNLTGIEFGMGNIAPYQIAGIQAWGGSADKMLETLRKRLKRFAPKYRTFLLQQMGLDPRLGALADLSDEEFAQRQAESRSLFLRPQDRKELQAMAQEFNKMFLAMQKMKDLFLILLAKVFNPITRAINRWVQYFNAIMEKTTDIVNKIKEIPYVVGIIKATLLALALFFKPVLTLVYLVVEDLMSWIAGGNSFFKELFTNTKELIDLWVSAISKLFGLSTDKEDRSGLGGFAGAGLRKWQKMDKPKFGDDETFSWKKFILGGTDYQLAWIDKTFGSRNMTINNEITINATDQVKGEEIRQGVMSGLTPLLSNLNSGGI